MESFKVEGPILHGLGFFFAYSYECNFWLRRFSVSVAKINLNLFSLKIEDYDCKFVGEGYP